jgi:hypothetical protein
MSRYLHSSIFKTSNNLSIPEKLEFDINSSDFNAVNINNVLLEEPFVDSLPQNFDNEIKSFITPGVIDSKGIMHYFLKNKNLRFEVDFKNNTIKKKFFELNNIDFVFKTDDNYLYIITSESFSKLDIYKFNIYNENLEHLTSYNNFLQLDDAIFTQNTIMMCILVNPGNTRNCVVYEVNSNKFEVFDLNIPSALNDVRYIARDNMFLYFPPAIIPSGVDNIIPVLPINLDTDVYNINLQSPQQNLTRLYKPELNSEGLISAAIVDTSSNRELYAITITPVSAEFADLKSAINYTPQGFKLSITNKLLSYGSLDLVLHDFININLKDENVTYLPQLTRNLTSLILSKEGNFHGLEILSTTNINLVTVRDIYPAVNGSYLLIN